MSQSDSEVSLGGANFIFSPRQIDGLKIKSQNLQMRGGGCTDEVANYCIKCRMDIFEVKH